jgi:hypothetical protein
MLDGDLRLTDPVSCGAEVRAAHEGRVYRRRMVDQWDYRADVLADIRFRAGDQRNIAIVRLDLVEFLFRNLGEKRNRSSEQDSSGNNRKGVPYQSKRHRAGIDLIIQHPGIPAIRQKAFTSVENSMKVR